MSNKFRIGLTMAGAVSAGAYTGGVMDYFFQVLDNWYAARERYDPTVPTHDISLDIISGASAGGITGAIAALALHLDNRNPVTPEKRNDPAYLKKNVFYDCWVNQLQPDMLPLLLDRSDIRSRGKVISLINSRFIELIAERTITTVPGTHRSLPAYVSQGMELILTLSNLNGFVYSLGFAGEGATHHIMRQHRDYAFFRLGNDYGGDGRIPLNFRRADKGIVELRQAAPATGAFPIGLAYRSLSRKKKYILDNISLIHRYQGVTNLIIPDDTFPDSDFISYHVDGGMLNNEPFDLTMRLMAKSSPDKVESVSGELEQSERQAEATIIMIDPFPSEDLVEPETPVVRLTGQPVPAAELFPYDLFEVMGKIYKSMRGELLFKGDDILNAFSKDDFSRFMIAPRRRVTDISEGQPREFVFSGSNAIACGALDGFAGFFDKGFREHDFILGRVNCQRFLRNYFRIRLENGVPVNPLFAAGYSPAAIARFRFQDEKERETLTAQGLNPDEAPWYIPVIPDVLKEDKQFDETVPVYPSYNMQQFDLHKSLLLQRCSAISNSLISNRVLRLAASLVFFLKKKSLYLKIRELVEKQFLQWKLIRSKP